MRFDSGQPCTHTKTWFAASERYEWGYVVEIKIPYKSIQYDKNLTHWGIDFDRWIPNKNEDIYWNYYEKNEGQTPRSC